MYSFCVHRQLYFRYRCAGENDYSHFLSRAVSRPSAFAILFSVTVFMHNALSFKFCIVVTFCEKASYNCGMRQESLGPLSNWFSHMHLRNAGRYPKRQARRIPCFGGYR